MSQFIETPFERNLLSSSQIDIVKGVFSKIFNFTTTSSTFQDKSHQRYFQKNLLEKTQYEQYDAAKLNAQALASNIHKIRENLTTYGRSKSHKLDKLFEGFPGHRQEERYSDEIKKISVKPNQVGRMVFMDRKYNQELVVQTAVLTELEQIVKLKQSVRRTRSTYSSPLIDRVRRERTTFTAGSSKAAQPNPVLQRGSRKTLKKKRKNQEYYMT